MPTGLNLFIRRQTRGFNPPSDHDTEPFSRTPSPSRISQAVANVDRPLPGGPVDCGQQQYQALVRADAAAGPPTQEEVIAEGYYLHPPPRPRTPRRGLRGTRGYIYAELKL